MTKYDLSLLEIQYTEGLMRLSEISKNFKIPYSTLLRYKKKYNWEYKRKIYISKYGYKTSYKSQLANRHYQILLIKDKLHQLVSKLEEKNLTEVYRNDINKIERTIKSIEKIG
jgi:hypothetical protein